MLALEPGKITEKMRQAFKAYGNLPRLRPSQHREGESKETARARCAPETKVDVVYRCIRKEESVTRGLCAPGKQRNGMRSIDDVVVKGSGSASCAISTSKDSTVCLSYAELWQRTHVNAGVGVTSGGEIKRELCDQYI